MSKKGIRIEICILDLSGNNRKRFRLAMKAMEDHNDKRTTRD